METSKYTTTQKQAIDEIAHQHYGTTKGKVKLLYKYNPQLCNYGPMIPAGVTIALPKMTENPYIPTIKLYE